MNILEDGEDEVCEEDDIDMISGSRARILAAQILG